MSALIEYQRPESLIVQFPSIMALAMLLSSSLAQASDTVVPSAALPQASSEARGVTLEVPRHIIAHGGGRSAGALWVIRGTFGQADADPAQPSVDSVGFYAITGGFWPGGPATVPRVDPLFEDRFENP